MDRNIKIASNRLLAVEGKDDYNFFEALLKHMNLAGVQIVDIGGKDNFGNVFSLLTNMDGFAQLSEIGIVRDAETNAAKSAFDSVAGVLRQHKLPIPSKPGEITLSGPPRVGVFIMPDNVEKGMLENLCLRTVEETPVYACINAYVQCLSPFLPEGKKAGFNEPKARVQTYLSSCIPIVNSLGVAALSGLWDLGHESLRDIRAFLSGLYGSQGCL